jgi:hypothetical protein
MAGLDPAIQRTVVAAAKVGTWVDARNKSGHDDERGNPNLIKYASN